MNQHKIEPLAVGDGRLICNQCKPFLKEAALAAATLLKGMPSRGKLD